MERSPIFKNLRIATICILLLMSKARAFEAPTHFAYLNIDGDPNPIIFSPKESLVGIGDRGRKFEVCSNKELCLYLEGLLISFPEEGENKKYKGLYSKKTGEKTLQLLNKSIDVDVFEVFGNEVSQKYFYSNELGLIAIMFSDSAGSTSLYFLVGEVGVKKSDIYYQKE